MEWLVDAELRPLDINELIEVEKCSVRVIKVTDYLISTSLRK